MNALTIATIVPHMIIRRAAHLDQAPAAATARTEEGRTTTFTATTVRPTPSLRATALHASQDLERRDIAQLLKLVVWIFQPMAARKNITLRLEAPDIGLYATCKEVRIQRVLENLISNALRHSPANSKVTLAARIEDGQLCVWVEDQGAGVPLSEQTSLFEGQDSSFGEFVYGGEEASRGLIASKEIVDAHGGEILMYNRVDGGAHFEFRLPSQNSRRGNTTPPHSGKVSTFTSTSKNPFAVNMRHAAA